MKNIKTNIFVELQTKLAKSFAILEKSLISTEILTKDFIDVINDKVNTKYNLLSESLNNSQEKFGNKFIGQDIPIVNSIKTKADNILNKTQLKFQFNSVNQLGAVVSSFKPKLEQVSMGLEKTKVLQQIFSSNSKKGILTKPQAISDKGYEVTGGLKFLVENNPLSVIMPELKAGAGSLITYFTEIQGLFTGFSDLLSNNIASPMINKGTEVVKSLFIGNEANIPISNDSVNKVKEATGLTDSGVNKNTNNNQTYNINVTGASNPIDTAKEVSKEISRIEQLSMVGG